jgi:hypothetical protein
MIAFDPEMALTVLEYLLQSGSNVRQMDKLAAEDVRIAQFLERIGFECSVSWRELARQELCC